MKDPGPNLLEQQIQTNTLLAAILAAGGAAPAPSAAGFGSVGIVYPALFLDPCAQTFIWAVTGTGEDYVCKYEPMSAFVGNKGLSMKTKTTTPASGDRVDAIMMLPGTDNPWILLQIMFALPVEPTNRPLFVIDVHCGDPDAAFTGHADWYLNVPEVRWDASAVLGPGANIADHAWNHAQICFNYKTGQRGFVKTNGIKYDHTAYNLRSEASISNIPIIRLTLTLKSLSANQASIDLDQLLITHHADLPD